MSGIPYLGSKISLISKSEIRYEGILVDVNAHDSTITLDKVSFFGTEGRRPGNDVPAMDKVFDSVVFRSSDIKDLQVYETTPEAQPEPPTQTLIPDPAIVSVAHVHAPTTTNSPPAVTMPKAASFAASVAASSGTRDRPQHHTGRLDYRPQQHQHQHQPMRQHPQQHKVVVPAAEFDFSTSNAKFQRPEDAQPGQAAEPAYNKTSSFFDNISCQATEQATADHRARTHNERDLNMETFGQAAPQRRHHGYGRARGRSGYHHRPRPFSSAPAHPGQDPS